MFIARSIASGELLDFKYATAFVRMPMLTGEAEKTYLAAYKKEDYEGFCDAPGEFHGCEHPIDQNLLLRFSEEEQEDAEEEMLQRKRQTAQFLHRADHDVESIYWVLVTTLLRAQPEKVSKDANLLTYYNTWKYFSQHVIMKGGTEDSRDAVLNLSVNKWKAALDPQLSSLGKMLYSMGKQIQPEYGLLQSPKAEHLHEAMRRLLLKQIVAMEKEPIRLQRGVLRPVPTPPALPSLKKRTGSYVSGSASGSKKLKASATDDGRRPRMIAQSHTIGE